MYNVDKSADIDSIADFIRHKLDIDVISIFYAKPPRGNADSAAFRICVRESDARKFCDTSRLPAGIVIREWYFKNSTNHPAAASPTRPGRDPRRASTYEIQLDDHAQFPPLPPNLSRSAPLCAARIPSTSADIPTSAVNLCTRASNTLVNAGSQPSTTTDAANGAATDVTVEAEGGAGGSGGGVQSQDDLAGSMDTGDQHIDENSTNQTL